MAPPSNLLEQQNALPLELFKVYSIGSEVTSTTGQSPKLLCRLTTELPIDVDDPLDDGKVAQDKDENNDGIEKSR